MLDRERNVVYMLKSRPLFFNVCIVPWLIRCVCVCVFKIEILSLRVNDVWFAIAFRVFAPSSRPPRVVLTAVL
jgi:hypothetical protein